MNKYVNILLPILIGELYLSAPHQINLYVMDPYRLITHLCSFWRETGGVGLVLNYFMLISAGVGKGD